MISEKELKKEIKNTKKFIKYLSKNGTDEEFITEVNLYLDGLLYCLNGKLD